MILTVRRAASARALLVAATGATLIITVLLTGLASYSRDTIAVKSTSRAQTMFARGTGAAPRPGYPRPALFGPARISGAGYPGPVLSTHARS